MTDETEAAAQEVSLAEKLISSIRVRMHPIGGHAQVEVWNRGGKIGTLMIDRSDVKAIVARLSGPETEVIGL